MAKAKEKVNVRKSGYDTGAASEFLVFNELPNFQLIITFVSW